MRLVSIFLIIAVSIAQNPIPLPKLNLQDIGGYWYSPWFVNEGNFNTNNYSNLCIGFNILTSLDRGTAQIAYEGSEGGSEGSFQIESISNSNSSWGIQHNLTITWVAIDPISSSWAVMSIAGGAFLLSRTPNTSALIVKGVTLLLNQEGFYVNSQDSFYTNQNCQQLIPTPTPLSGLNLSAIGGVWYLPWGYNISNTDTSSTCFTAEVSFKSTYSADLNITVFGDGVPGGSQNYSFEIAVSNTAIWVIEYVPLYWIAADTVDYQWGLGVFQVQNRSIVWLVSRTPTIDSSIISSAITTLQNQGIPTSNLVYYSSQC